MSKRLPHHLAWPVKPSQAASALEGLGAVRVVFMFWNRTPSVTVARVTWTPEDPGLTGAVPVTGATLWVAPVARDGVETTRSLAIDRVLPEACAWLEAALTAGEPWKATRHERAWSVVGGTVHHTDRDGVATLRG